MDYNLRELERKVIEDPSLRGQLLTKYLHAGRISNNAVVVAASLGHPAAIEIVGPQSLNNLPKKVCLALALGATQKLHDMIYVLFDEPDEEEEPDPRAEEMLYACQYLRQAVQKMLDGTEKTIDISIFRMPLTLQECIGYAKSRLDVAMVQGAGIWIQQTGLEPDIQGYLRTHLFLARTSGKKPMLRSKATIQDAAETLSYLDYPLPDALKIMSDAANHYALLTLLGPLLVQV